MMSEISSTCIPGEPFVLFNTESRFGTAAISDNCVHETGFPQAHLRGIDTTLPLSTSDDITKPCESSLRTCHGCSALPPSYETATLPPPPYRTFFPDIPNYEPDTGDEQLPYRHTGDQQLPYRQSTLANDMVIPIILIPLLK